MIKTIGSFSDRYSKYMNKFGFWANAQDLIDSVWDSYNNRYLEISLKKNLELQPKNYDLYCLGCLTEREYKEGKLCDTVGWIETYTYFPCLHDLPQENPKSFYEKIKEPFEYNCNFLLENIDNLPLIFDYFDGGIRYWNEIVEESLITFSQFSEKAKELLKKLEDLNWNK